MKINVAIHVAAVQHRLQHHEGITFKGSGSFSSLRMENIFDPYSAKVAPWVFDPYNAP